MLNRVLVTGATGNVGRTVVHALLRRGIHVRAGSSTPARLGAGREPNLETVRLDFWDAATFSSAVEGCDGLFLLRPPAIAQVRRTLLPLLGAARRAGVRHVVFLSVQGAERNRFIPHHAVERALIAGPGGFTLLRPGFFVQNLGDAYRQDISLDARLYVPAGDGRVAFIDTRDIAEVAALCLADPTLHDRQAYTLTGAQALSFHEVAALLSRALARPIHYEPASVLGYALHLRRRGASLPQAAVLCALHVGLRFGQAERIDPTLGHLLGVPPRTLQDYISEHLERWRPPGSQQRERGA